MESLHHCDGGIGTGLIVRDWWLWGFTRVTRFSKVSGGMIGHAADGDGARGLCLFGLSDKATWLYRTLPIKPKLTNQTNLDRVVQSIFSRIRCHDC